MIDRASTVRKRGPRGWGGAQPGWSPQRVRAIRDLRRFEAAEECDELPREAAVCGGAELACRFERGKVYAYRLEEPFWLTQELDPRERLALRWVLAVQLGIRNPETGEAYEWLYAKHSDMGRLLGGRRGRCSTRTAGGVMRKLLKLGWLVAVPMHRRCSVTHRHDRKPYAYRVPDEALARLEIRSVQSGNCQPADKHRVTSACTYSGLEHGAPALSAEPGLFGAPPPAAGESIVTVPDEGPVDDPGAEAPERAATPAEAPEGAPALARWQSNPAELRAVLERDLEHRLAAVRAADRARLAYAERGLAARRAELEAMALRAGARAEAEVARLRDRVTELEAARVADLEAMPWRRGYAKHTGEVPNLPGPEDEVPTREELQRELEQAPPRRAPPTDPRELEQAELAELDRVIAELPVPASEATPAIAAPPRAPRARAEELTDILERQIRAANGGELPDAMREQLEAMRGRGL